MADNCTTCKFYGATLMLCRRYAPRPELAMTAEAKRYDAVWPWVKENDWCGEWAAVAAPA